MNIIISGYGRMGKEVEKQALKHHHSIAGIIDKDSDWNNKTIMQNADVVIDFSLPETAINNIYRCFENNIPIITGTTGWYDRIDEVTKKCHDLDQTLFYAPNFSIGVNLFFDINEKMARLMNGQLNYDVKVSETHHMHKKDAPSGTAKKLTDLLLGKIKRYSGWVLNKEGKDKLPVYAYRYDEVPGTHEVTYNSDVDIITLKHEAKSREGFALGAVKAAEWVKDKPGVFTMKDFLNS
ncbi:MAG: 4-hydroxy-tetrahydrodipicolinate reductase [Bacteroidota bacterium]